MVLWNQKTHGCSSDTTARRATPHHHMHTLVWELRQSREDSLGIPGAPSLFYLGLRMAKGRGFAGGLAGGLAALLGGLALKRDIYIFPMFWGDSQGDSLGIPGGLAPFSGARSETMCSFPTFWGGRLAPDYGSLL